jgi:hypothetical protein
MPSLLIDFDNIVKPNKMGRLADRVGAFPETQDTLGLVLTVSDEQYSLLNSLPKGKQRVAIINSSAFVDSISDHASLLYDKSSKLCSILYSSIDIIPEVVALALRHLPNDVVLHVSVRLDNPEFDKAISVCSQAEFSNPRVHGGKAPELQVFRCNCPVMDKGPSLTNWVGYALDEWKGDSRSCTTTAFLGAKTVKYLEQATRIGSTLNKDGGISQKELAGSFDVASVGNDSVFELMINLRSIVRGHEEYVQIVKGMFNFHTHPVEAYKRHDVVVGWPSATDYVGFMASALTYGTICHIVACVEGYYVVSVAENFLQHYKKVEFSSFADFVDEHYDIEKTSERSYAGYVTTINAIRYKGLQPFVIQFFPWEKGNAHFTVHSLRVNGGCPTEHVDSMCK